MTTRSIQPRRSRIVREAYQRADLLAASDDTSFNTMQAAAFVGCSAGYLETKRCEGGGPPFRRISPRMIRYLKSDLIEWLRSRARHQSTREYATD
jgi:predicted DNA-binding transcriptional regulator AlpA